MRLINRAAAFRVAILLLISTLFVAWCWKNMIRMPGKSFSGVLPDLSAGQQALATELKQHVQKLAGEIGERNVFQPAKYRASADYIRETFRSMAYQVAEQAYTTSGEECLNLAAEATGKSSEIIIVGAHYDSVLGSPGANDNASGVASLLALAWAWARHTNTQERSIRFVAFANEEPPFFQTENMGSLVYARRCRERQENIVAMLSLETMGFFNSSKGSQRYPFPVGLFYPSAGNFIAFVGNSRNAPLVRECIKTFRSLAAFPSEGAALPGNLPGIEWSDHWSFGQVGYPAIMITDTAPFRYPHYHSAEDLPDKLDYDKLARVVDGLRFVLTSLANPK